MGTKFAKLTKGQLSIIVNASGTLTKKELISLANDKLKDRLHGAMFQKY